MGKSGYYIKKPIPVLCTQQDEAGKVYDKLHDTHIPYKKGDWIIEGIRGETYPCEESVFAETYEPAP